MTNTILLLFIISSLVLSVNANSEELYAGRVIIPDVLRPTIRSDGQAAIQSTSLKTDYRLGAIQEKSVQKQNPTKITGVVVAYNNGVVLTEGPCRQLMVVLVTRRNKGIPKETYVLVRREYACNDGAFPAAMFQAKQRWEFSLIRDSSCDHTFEEIMDIVQMTPASGSYRIPVMKRVAGVKGKMPTTVKFSCYRLSGEIKPSGKRVS
jgi:hypothetical protein